MADFLSLRKQVFDYLSDHPKSKIKQLLNAFKGENKNTLADYLKQWRKMRVKKYVKDVSIPPKKVGYDTLPLHSEHLTEEVIEQKVLHNLLKLGTSQDVRNAIDFYAKIKAAHSQVQEIDLEKFLLIGEDNPDA